jgi:hypothetical protein
MSGILRGEVIRQLLHADHVAVIHGRDGELGFGRRRKTP